MAHTHNNWNYEHCKTEARKYTKRSHFKNQSPSAYGAARKNGWLDEICSHMVLTRNQKIAIWSDFEECKKEADKYRNKSDFFARNKVAYLQAETNGWLDLFYLPTKVALSGWWNDKARCRDEALKYTSISDFIKYANGAYASVLKHGWKDELCSHMTRKWEKKWADKETCRKEALKYKTRTEFQRCNDGAYTYALRHGILDEICTHMELVHVVKWNSKEACHNEALKYNTRAEFQNGCNGAYTYALKHGFLDEICGHMEVVGNMQKRCIYAFEFDDNHVYVGLTCNIRRRERSHLTKKKSPVFSHIESTGLTPQLIIVHDYTSKDVAGILEDDTINIYRKNGWHILNRVKAGAMGSLPKKWTKERCLSTLQECSSLAEFKTCFPGAYNSCLANKWMDEVYQIYPETYTLEEIRKEASKYQYRKDFWRYSRDAYNSALKQRLLRRVCSEFDLKMKKNAEENMEVANLNISEQELEELKTIAQKYQTKKAFKNEDRAAYNKACRLRILQVVCSHMIRAQKFWSKDECSAIAQKYNSRSEFRKNDTKAYNAASDHGWLDDICAHMPKPVPQKKWVKEECAAIALKYNQRSEFRKNDWKAYDAASHRGWLNEICGHMPKPTPPRIWAKEVCATIAKKYNRRCKMIKNDCRAYNAARKYGWLDEICCHMKPVKKHVEHFFWTKERCQERALLYGHRVDFKNGDGSAYTTAVRCGWLDEVCSHMTKPTPKVKWTKEECHKVALKYKTAREFRKQERSVYATALHKGWLEDISSHLIFTSRRGLGRKYKM